MTKTPADLPPLRDVIRDYQLSARKGLGQHFLLDLNLTGRIARSAGDLSTGTTIEIGPGPGGLTRALLAAGAQVIAIEKDHRCLAALADVAAAYPGKLDVVAGDALSTDIVTLGNEPRRVVANLPYNIGTDLILGWLAKPEAFSSITVMVQKEVADRLAAQPGAKPYGRLSVFAGWRWHVRKDFDVNPKAFTPPPKVDSSVVHLTPRAEPLAEADETALARVTAAAFGQRRKMLRTSLKSLGDAEALCAAVGIEPTLRPEQVDIEAFCALARIVSGAP
jgi:16S rRNA (adenine1518-N6/adenine1519-N6)-dimethyltransferase